VSKKKDEAHARSTASSWKRVAATAAEDSAASFSVESAAAERARARRGAAAVAVAVAVAEGAPSAAPESAMRPPAASAAPATGASPTASARAVVVRVRARALILATGVADVWLPVRGLPGTLLAEGEGGESEPLGVPGSTGAGEASAPLLAAGGGRLPSPPAGLDLPAHNMRNGSAGWDANRSAIESGITKRIAGERAAPRIDPIATGVIRASPIADAAELRGKHVAVLGWGPAALCTAAQLRALSSSVTIFTHGRTLAGDALPVARSGGGEAGGSRETYSAATFELLAQNEQSLYSRAVATRVHVERARIARIDIDASLPRLD
jgi:hypothetical protein